MANENENVENEGTKINWAKVAVRDAHGAIDKDATLALCDEELTSHIGNEVDMTEIASSVAQVFTKLTRGGEAQKAMIDLDGLATRAFGLLPAAPLGSETLLKKRIMDFVRGESLRFTETNGAEGLYHIKRGKDGGVRLNTPAYVAEFRALQAKKVAAK